VSRVSKNTAERVLKKHRFRQCSLASFVHLRASEREEKTKTLAREPPILNYPIPNYSPEDGLGERHGALVL
jgi:hypothetical protein